MKFLGIFLRISVSESDWVFKESQQQLVQYFAKFVIVCILQGVTVVSLNESIKTFS
jgi:hypothetical protein